MLSNNDLNESEELLIRELHGFIRKGELDNGDEIDEFKDIFECLKMIYHLRANMSMTV